MSQKIPLRPPKRFDFKKRRHYNVQRNGVRVYLEELSVEEQRTLREALYYDPLFSEQFHNNLEAVVLLYSAILFETAESQSRHIKTIEQNYKGSIFSRNMHDYFIRFLVRPKDIISFAWEYAKTEEDVVQAGDTFKMIIRSCEEKHDFTQELGCSKKTSAMSNSITHKI